MDPERKPEPPNGSVPATPEPQLAGAGAMAGLGLQFALSILLFLWLGQWIDRKLGTNPLFLIAFVFIGAAASFYSIYRKLMEWQRRDEERKRR